MPTYDYVCTECGKEFEEFQKMSDPVLTECPRCHNVALKRLIGAGSGMIFKGSGFYLTDYKNKGNGPVSSPQKINDKKSSAKSTETTSESSSKESSSTENKTTSDKTTSDKSTSDKQ